MAELTDVQLFDQISKFKVDNFEEIKQQRVEIRTRKLKNIAWKLYMNL